MNETTHPTTHNWAEQSRRILGWNQTPELIPIYKGGSDRDFHRLLLPEGSAILMVFSPEKEENQYYAAIARFLRDIGLPVPEILAEDPASRAVWIEDAGALDLHSFHNRPWNQQRDLHHAVITAAAPLHRSHPDAARLAGTPTLPGFNTASYAWERSYFYDEFVTGVCGIHLTATDRSALDHPLEQSAMLLANGPASLVHRDFQSQNILWRSGLPVFIDFQGMRPGSPFYDLASFIDDPYMPRTFAQRQELVQLAFATNPFGLTSDAFREHLDRASLQRLMQALGAYGFLGKKRGKKSFLTHIPTALERLAATAQRTEMDGLARLLERCAEEITITPE